MGLTAPSWCSCAELKANARVSESQKMSKTDSQQRKLKKKINNRREITHWKPTLIKKKKPSTRSHSTELRNSAAALLSKAV